MVLKDLLSISGQGGLFKFVAQGRNGVIVENIETKKKLGIPATAKMSSLEDIAIFTENEEVQLSVVMDKIFEKENGGPTISHKTDNKQLKEFMETILPEYDKERVYVSDMKKLVLWYNLLQKHDLLIKEEEKEEKEESEKEGEIPSGELEKTEDKAAPKSTAPQKQGTEKEKGQGETSGKAAEEKPNKTE
jgi:hypothetical protein